MKNTRFLSFISCIGAAFVAVAVGVITFLVAPIIFLFNLAFPFSGEPIGHDTPIRNIEYADRQSQTGKDVWAFVTNLFGVEGRTYCHQGGNPA